MFHIRNMEAIFVAVAVQYLYCLLHVLLSYPTYGTCMCIRVGMHEVQHCQINEFILTRTEQHLHRQTTYYRLNHEHARVCEMIDQFTNLIEIFAKQSELMHRKYFIVVAFEWVWVTICDTYDCAIGVGLFVFYIVVGFATNCSVMLLLLWLWLWL